MTTATTATPLKLCYATECWAWFTTADLKDQWGDDWDDAPYEHNAGLPYEWWSGSHQPRYRLQRVAWSGDFQLPSDGHLNSPYSVQRINAGVVPWLVTSSPTQDVVTIPAGTELSRFIELVEAGGGTVYLARDSSGNS